MAAGTHPRCDMQTQHPGRWLREQLSHRRGMLVAGAGLTNHFYGLPDLGFMGLHDVAAHTAAIRDVVALPLIVDADTGVVE